MKTCSKCGLVKDESDFYRDKRMLNGHRNSCKSCDKAEVPMDKIVDRVRRYRERNPEKYKAHYTVRNAIRDGRLKRRTCEICDEKAQSHHDDYSKPLDVRWLCTKHHTELHRKERECVLLT